MEKQPGEIAVIGLGRMGRGIARRLLKAGIATVVWNRSPEPRQELAKAGAIAVERLNDVPAKLKRPRVVWSMLPAGAVTEETLLGDEGFLHLLETGDIMIDGGNARYHDSVRRAKVFAKKGIYFLDIGTSGGLAGEEQGYCLMVGGELAAYEYVRPLLEAIAQPEGFAYFGPSGAGHFVKMVHNAIEYGMMQAFGEGLELIKSSPYADIDLKSLLHVWNHGSIIESFLGRTLEKELAADPELASYSGQVGYTGEATWALQEALAFEVPLSVIAEALFARYRSMRDKTFANKVVAALRHGFGGHLNVERTQEASPPGL